MEDQGKKQIDAITNQNERLEASTNKDYHKSIFKEIFYKLVKAKLDEIKQRWKRSWWFDILFLKYYC